MARCRTLLKENEELGKQISQGRIAKLEGEIALEKKLVEEMRVAQNGEGLVAMMWIFYNSCHGIADLAWQSDYFVFVAWTKHDVWLFVEGSRGWETTHPLANH